MRGISLSTSHPLHGVFGISRRDLRNSTKSRTSRCTDSGSVCKCCIICSAVVMTKPSNATITKVIDCFIEVRIIKNSTERLCKQENNELCLEGIDSVCYEARGVVSRHRPGAEFHEVGIVRGLQGEHRFSAGQRIFAQSLDFSAHFGVSDQDTVGKRGDTGIAPGGDACRWRVGPCRRKRKESGDALRRADPASLSESASGQAPAPDRPRRTPNPAAARPGTPSPWATGNRRQPSRRFRAASAQDRRS